MFSEPMVWLSVLRDKTPLAERIPFYHADAPRPRFLEGHPVHSWLSDSILRFGNENPLPQSRCDTIVVRNSSSRVIKHLEVEGVTDEIFLVLDLKPNESVKLYSQPENDLGIRYSSLGASGEFDGGPKGFDGTTSFDLRGGHVGPGHYCITVTDHEVSIKSEEFDGERLVPRFGEPPVSRVSNDNEPTLKAGLEKIVVPKESGCSFHR